MLQCLDVKAVGNKYEEIMQRRETYQGSDSRVKTSSTVNNQLINYITEPRESQDEVEGTNRTVQDRRRARRQSLSAIKPQG